MRQSLANRAARGVAWAFLSTGASKLITLLGLVVLARLLAPAEFGVVAFALLFITYVEVVGDLGVGMALIYWPDRREEASAVAFLLNLATGTLWFVVGWLVAPWVAAFFHYPESVPLLRALTLSFLIKGLGNTHDMLLRKDLRFRDRLLPEAAFAVIKAATAVILAWRGFGAWSLVWGQLAGLAAQTSLLWVVSPWRPSWRPRLDLLRPMLGYGRGIVAVNALAAVVHHVDLVIVGRFLGAATLGMYQMASKIPDISITTTVRITGKVLFPAFARIHSQRGRLDDAYLAALRYIALATMPLAVVLVILTEPIVRLMLGAAWLDTVPILRTLAIYTCLRALGSHAGDVLKAAGKPTLVAWLGAAKAIVLVPALLLAAGRGAVAVATVLTAVTLWTVALNLYVVRRQIGLAWKDVARALEPGLVASTLLVVCLLGWTRIAVETPAAIVVVTGGLLAGAVVLVALLWLYPDVIGRALDVVSPESGTRPAGPVQMLSEVDRFVVSLGSRPAFRYFLEILFIAHGRRERLRHRLARVLPPPLAARCLGGRLWRQSSDAVEAVTEGAADRTGLDSTAVVAGIDMLRRALREDSLRAAARLPGVRRIDPILLYDYPGSERGGVIALLFAGGSVPKVVLKIAPSVSAGSLRRESEALERVRSELSESLARSVPRVLASRAVGSAEVLALEPLPGRSGYAELFTDGRSRERVRLHLVAAARWLARFHAETRDRGTVQPRLDGRSIGPPLRLCARHGDFWVRNVLFDRRSAAREMPSAVVDWEHARESASPLDDLFHYPLTYALNLPWSGGGRQAPDSAFHRAFLGRSHVTASVREYFELYCSASDVAWETLLELFCGYLAAHDFRGDPSLTGRRGAATRSRFVEALVAAPRTVFTSD